MAIYSNEEDPNVTDWEREQERIQIKNTKKKDLVEQVFIRELTKFGMDVPSNFEDIVQFIFEDVCETADENDWHSGDVVIGFRRWIEAQGE